MTKVIAINGSPRMDGNTSRLPVAVRVTEQVRSRAAFDGEVTGLLAAMMRMRGNPRVNVIRPATGGSTSWTQVRLCRAPRSVEELRRPYAG